MWGSPDCQQIQHTSWMLNSRTTVDLKNPTGLQDQSIDIDNESAQTIQHHWQTLCQSQIATEVSCWKDTMDTSLTQAIYWVLYWKGIHKCITGGQIATTVLWQWASRDQIEYKDCHLLLNQAAAMTQVKEAAKDYLQFKKQADHRDIWIGQLIEAQAAATGTTKKSRWKKIWLTEAIRRKAFAVKWVLGQLETHCGLLQVTAPVMGSNTNWITYTNKEQIELACLEEAHQQFTQAAETPMLQKPMISCLGLASINSSAFQQILDGTSQCPPTCEPITKCLIQQLTWPEGVVDHQLWTYKEFQSG